MASIRRPSPNFDGAAAGNNELRQALINSEGRLRTVEAALGIGGLNPDKQTKVSTVPPRAGITINNAAGTGMFTLSLLNPEFQLKGGNPLRNPIYHKVRYSSDPSFNSGVTELPPSVQTHWPIIAPKGVKLYTQVSQSYDGINWNLPIIKGPFTGMRGNITWRHYEQNEVYFKDLDAVVKLHHETEQALGMAMDLPHLDGRVPILRAWIAERDGVIVGGAYFEAVPELCFFGRDPEVTASARLFAPTAFRELKERGFNIVRTEVPRWIGSDAVAIDAELRKAGFVPTDPEFRHYRYNLKTGGR